MKTTRVILSVLFFSVSWPGLSFGEFPHPQESSGQGAATGRPEMRDPYGVDQDRSRDETGNQGRPIHDPWITLPVPHEMKALWGGENGSGALGVHYGITRYLRWSIHTDPHIKGFRIYEQVPGEATYHRYLDVPVDNPGAVKAGGRWVGVSISTCHHLMSGQAEDSRGTSDGWSPGTYRYYVVALDAVGREGGKSAIAPCTILKPIPVTWPTEGAVVTEPLVVQWSEDVSRETRANDPYNLTLGSYNLSFVSGRTPVGPRGGFFHSTAGACSLDQTQYYYHKEPLKKGETYVLGMLLSYSSPDPVQFSRYGPVLGYSRDIQFKAGDPAPGFTSIQPRPSSSPVQEQLKGTRATVPVPDQCARETHATPAGRQTAPPEQPPRIERQQAPQPVSQVPVPRRETPSVAPAKPQPQRNPAPSATVTAPSSSRRR